MLLRQTKWRITWTAEFVRRIYQLTMIFLTSEAAGAIIKILYRTFRFRLVRIRPIRTTEKSIVTMIGYASVAPGGVSSADRLLCPDQASAGLVGLNNFAQTKPSETNTQAAASNVGTLPSVAMPEP